MFGNQEMARRKIKEKMKERNKRISTNFNFNSGTGNSVYNENVWGVSRIKWYWKITDQDMPQIWM